MPIVFSAPKSRSPLLPTKKYTEHTKAYVGPLEPGIFEKLKHVEYIYTAFPEGRIRKRGGGNHRRKTKDQLVRELEEHKIDTNGYVRDMLESKDFTVSQNVERLDLVRLSVKDLGFPDGATVLEIFIRAQELGLDLCPAEVGPHLRLQYVDQPLNEWVSVAMKQIAGRGGFPGVFALERGGGGLWLSSRWAGPGDWWGADNQLAFSLRK